MNLEGLWKCKSAGGIYLIHQDGKEITIHGIGIKTDKFDNFGFGKIDNNEKFIIGVWKDTPYSANPENCKNHQFKAEIISDSKLKDVKLSCDDDKFGYGDFEKVKTIADLQQF